MERERIKLGDLLPFFLSIQKEERNAFLAVLFRVFVNYYIGKKKSAGDFS